MICNACRRTAYLSARRPSRLFSTLSEHRQQVAAAAAAAEKTQPTPATSSSVPGISQPLSAPFFPSTSSATITNGEATDQPPAAPKVRSSIAGGQELKGLAYLKGKPQVLAKEDDQYPTWLWTILEDSSTADGSTAVDLSTLNKKQRTKYERKQAKLLKDIPKPIPLHEQSRDLTSPGDDAITSLQRRQDLTKSSREARRKEIRESNFLKGV